MKKSRYNEAQIIGIIKQAEAGMPARDVCRQNGISETTFYKWRAKYGGMEVFDAMRLKQLEEENTRLKKMVADLMLDNTMLRDIASKNFKRPTLSAAR